MEALELSRVTLANEVNDLLKELIKAGFTTKDAENIACTMSAPLEALYVAKKGLLLRDINSGPVYEPIHSAWKILYEAQRAHVKKYTHACLQ